MTGSGTEAASARVPVRGGELAVGVWNAHAPEARTVLAIHGISASHRAWSLVAQSLPGVRVIAPDLRGRGHSNRLPPPWGIREHADDLVRVLDRFEVDRAVLLGHSMGGFVAVRVAAQHPDRVRALVLVDGGLPLPGPEGAPPPGEGDRAGEDDRAGGVRAAEGDRAAGDRAGESDSAGEGDSAGEVAVRLLGPAGERLTRVFPDRGSYLDYWREHPAFRADWSDTVEQYLDYDLEETEGGFRSRARLEAVAANATQLSGDDGYDAALSGLRTPVDFLRAPRGLLNETPGLYPAAVIDRSLALLPGLRVHEVADVNHYSIVMAPAGAARVAAQVAGALRNAPPS